MARDRLARTLQTLLAGLVLLGSGALISGCSLVDDVTPGGGKVTVKAYLADAAGLFVGNDVGVLGVNIGTISAIEPVGDKVLVTMKVDADQPLPADVGAAVVARSVATDRYIELTPVYRKGPKLGAGATIPVQRTRTPVDFDEVLSALNDFATGISGNRATTKAVQRFIDAGTAALQGRGPLINQTILSLADGVDAISAQRGDIAATLRSLDVLLSAIAKNESTARTFVRQVADASQFLAEERGNFRETLRALDRAVTLVAKFAVDNREAIVRTLDGTSGVMDTVLAKQKQLEEVLRDMPLALQNIARIQGDRLPVRIDPLILDPLGGVLQAGCAQLPGELCNIIDGLPLGK